MSVQTGMYRIQPIFELDKEITLPDCMYHMKNVHAGHQHIELGKTDAKPHSISEIIMEQVKRILQTPPPEVEMLEHQQEEILKKLAILKEQIENFRLQLKSGPSASPAKTVTVTECEYYKGDINDIVLYANPSAPPYGILALSEMWGRNISLTNHSHSTLRFPVSQSVVQAFTRNATTQSHQLRITLVWKDENCHKCTVNVAVGRHLQLVISPTKHTIIQGEVNMLRLLACFGPVHLSLDNLNAEEASVADWILDSIYLLSQASAPKRDLNATLQRLQPGQSGWLLSQNNPTIVDTALWSYLKSKGALDCPPKLKDWQKQCDRLFLK